MSKISKAFTVFMMTALKILLVVALIPTVSNFFSHILGINISFFIMILLVGITIICGYKLINCNMNYNKKIGIIFAWSIVVRILWIVNVNSVPTSDFGTMYEAAGNFLQGDTSMFKDTAYIARNPHLTIMVIYMAVMRGIFPTSNLLAMKVINVFLGAMTVYLIYLIVRKLFNDKYGLYAAIATSIFPPLVTYTAVFCTENIAIPLYLLSIYLFLLVVKDKKSFWLLILCGITLCIGHLFRMVAQVVVLAFILYILLYCKQKLIHKFRDIGIIFVPFILLFIITSSILQSINITQYPLWKGAEPNITSILKGTHISSGGAWNEEDAKVPEECNFDYDKITEVCKDTIIQRLTTTPPLVLFNFYLNKFMHQWDEGDLSGIFWSELDVPKDEILINISGGGMAICQAIYALMMILTLVGTFNKRALENNPEIKLFYLLLCGYGAVYFVTESQSRYSYIVCWLFVILAVAGMEQIYIKKNEVKMNNAKKS